ncbi:MAG: stage sporulation protein [Mucilaginibacter sp.]|nr:stage sporulation protein [Mucilaginibacter sp.]
MPKGNKLLFAEALVTSACVRFTLSFLPFKIVKGWLGKTNTRPDIELSPAQLLQIKKTYHMLKLCDKYAFWKTECYTLALTGKILLRRRDIPSTLYIGWKKDNGKYEGHAWLKTANDAVISGNMDLTQFQVNAYFS